MTRDEHKKRGKRVVEDGETIHVPLFMMDSGQRAAATKVTDAFGRPAGSAVGYIFRASDAVSIALEDSYERRKGALAAAWCSR